MNKWLLRVGFLAFCVAAVWVALKYPPQINFPISQDRSADITVETDGLSIQHDRIGTHTLVTLDSPLELFVQPGREQSLSQILRSQSARLVTNGGYYYFEKDKVYYSGLLIAGGRQHSPLNTRNTTQISHVMFWKNGELGVTTAANAQAQVGSWITAGFNALQTGPLLINDNQLQTNFIQAADNANGRYLRTVVGQLLSGEKFIWVQKVPLTLMDLTEMIQLHPKLKGKIDFALNLDGGSSTSLMISNYSAANFFVDKVLPAVLLVK